MKTKQARAGRGTVQLEALLGVAIEQANDGIAIMKFTGDAEVPIRIVFANAAIERLSGFTREELFDPQNPFLKAQPQHRERYQTLLDRLRGGSSARFEIELGGKDRSTWTEIRWSPLQSNGEAVTHYVAVLRDISKRRQLEAHRDLLAVAIEQAHDGMCIVEVFNGDARTRRISYANDAICEMMKMPREKILAEGLIGPLFSASAGLCEQYLANVSNGQVFERDVLGTRGDGTQRWIHVTASPLRGEAGAIDRVAVTYRDIHERKQNDEQLELFRSILSKASELILMTDGTRPSEGGPRLTYANPAFAVLLGQESGALVGRPLTSFLSQRNGENLLLNIASRLEQHEPVSYEVLLRHPNQNLGVWTDLSGHPVRDAAGQATSWFFIGTDISARKQSYIQTAQLIRALDSADEPIMIYDVTKRRELQVQHMNERALQLKRPLIETLQCDAYQRGRLESIWPALESGKTVNRLVYVGEADARRWVTMEVRPMNLRKRSTGAIVVIEHALQLAPRGGETDCMQVALVLAHEILRYSHRATRRDAIVEVLRNTWNAKALFKPATGEPEVSLRATDCTGHAIMGAGVVFEQQAAVDFTWEEPLAPRELTAQRVFLETLAHAAD